MLDKDLFISEAESLRDALRKLEKTSERVLLVTDDKNRLKGTITDGDIRRYILSGKPLENDIREVYNKNPFFMKKDNFSKEEAKRLLVENKIELIPLLDAQNRPVDFVTWSQVFNEENRRETAKGKINVPVVIMAGGRGFRLEPFTRIIPKPLIPIGDRAIIEIIIDEFKKQGATKYFVTINSKGEIIKSYFDSIEKDYEINYISEKNGFLGTCGSLKYLEDKISDIFIVSNCDVIVKADFEEVISYHKEKKASLTVLSAIQHYKIPYGIIKFSEGGEVTDIHEKPEYTFTINAGVYILNKQSLKLIPENTPFDMTDLIKALIENKKKVIMYPVNENDYIDIGQWEEYKKAVEKLHFII